MEQSLHTQFTKAKHYPERRLADGIWATISKREKRRAELYSGIYIATSALSLALLIPAVRELSSELTQSGFTEYASILFSQEFFLYWKDIAYTVTEALPTLSITLCLGLFFIGFATLIKSIRTITSLRITTA